MSKEKKQTKETTAHPLQVNKDFVFPNGLGAGGDEESESYLAAVGYFLSGNGLYGKKMDVREVYDIDDVLNKVDKRKSPYFSYWKMHRC